LGFFSINPTFLPRAVHVHRTLFFAIPTGVCRNTSLIDLTQHCIRGIVLFVDVEIPWATGYMRVREAAI
jgi:hypothetical protein